MSISKNTKKPNINANLINNYLKELDWQVKENSNMSYSLQGLRNFVSSEITKKYWLQEVYPKQISKAHVLGDLHLHDLAELNAYCCGWDLQDLLRMGFTGVKNKISARPAKHFGVALGQIVNFIYTLQGETAGAQAFSNFDTLLAPFIAYDKLNYTQVKQEIQSFVYNVNIPTRVGFQTPFFNITLDMNVPSYLGNENVMIGGEVKKEKYSDFQKEMDMLNQAFAEVMMEGDGDGKIFTFPIPTYNITKDFDWNDSRFDTIWEMTSKFGTPYFANYVNSDMNPEDARSMCCRLRLDNRELRRRGGLFSANPLTGSIGVVTINMPRLGLLAKSKVDFLVRLEKLMDLASQSLEIKRTLIEKLTDQGLYPYSQFYLQNTKQRHNQYWHNHFSTIGLLGMNEAIANLFPGENIASSLGHKFAEEVLDFMRKKVMVYQTQTGNLYNLEATPAEATSYRLARLDKKKFLEKANFANTLEVKNNLAEPYYTNSSHLPVGYTDDIFEALDLQDGLQTKYTGGTVLHGFLGEKIEDLKTTKNLVKVIAQNYHLPYFTITPTFSICPEHGYQKGEHKHCPDCQKECLVYSRIVGYHTPVQNWNVGKKAEWQDRKTYDKQLCK